MKTLVVLLGLVALAAAAAVTRGRNSRYFPALDAAVKDRSKETNYLPALAAVARGRSSYSDILLKKIAKSHRDPSLFLNAKASYLHSCLDYDEDGNLEGSDFQSLADFVAISQDQNATQSTATHNQFQTLFERYFSPKIVTAQNLTDYVTDPTRLDGPFDDWNDEVCGFFFGFVDANQDHEIQEAEYINIYKMFFWYLPNAEQISQDAWDLLDPFGSGYLSLIDYTTYGYNFFTLEDTQDPSKFVFGPAQLENK